MFVWQTLFLLFFAFFNLVIALKGFHESHKKENAYGEIFYLGPLGVFVWGDAVVFGIFWALIAGATLILQDWILFWLVASLFWVVRSFGETMYWFNQQFSTIERVAPKGKFLFNYFHNDSVWFIYQILQQCITVVALVASIYFGHMWLEKI